MFLHLLHLIKFAEVAMYRTIHRYIKDNVIINLGENPERMQEYAKRMGLKKVSRRIPNDNR